MCYPVKVEDLKFELRVIFQHIFEHWVPDSSNTTELQHYTYYCTSEFGFKPLFVDSLDQRIRQLDNKSLQTGKLKTLRENIDVHNQLF